MRTATALAALALVSTTLLTGCGSEQDSAYCKDLKADKSYFQTFSGSGSTADPSKLGTAFSKLHSLAKESPKEVSDDWKVIDDALTTVEKAFKDAGISFSDLPALEKGQVPKGADMQKLSALGTKLQSLTGSKFSTAGKAIEKHAKSTCKVTIGNG